MKIIFWNKNLTKKYFYRLHNIDLILTSKKQTVCFIR